jgi:uncharacterized protein (TIGR02996 family)
MRLQAESVMSHDLEPSFLDALHADPTEETSWLALADWLEETGQEERAELIRLTRQLHVLPVLRRSRARTTLENRLQELLRKGVRPAVPEVTNSLGMRFALIPPGRFRMGASTSENGRMKEEMPAHEVTITKPYYLAIHPVTQELFQQLMGFNPSHFCAQGDGTQAVNKMNTSSFPVERATWHEAITFCEHLSALPAEQNAKRVYRLPTEAEWEYAYRGGACTITPFYLGNTIRSTEANFDGHHPYPRNGGVSGPYHGRPCNVGSYLPNVFGLYDMAGNVWEWCNDWFSETYYRKGPRIDPPGPRGGSRRVLRGGAHWNWGGCCRGARRVRNTPESREQAYGFRVAMNVVAR